MTYHPDIDRFPMKNRQTPDSRQHMRGVTLVELMIALMLMLLITTATVAVYLSNAQSNRTVDASQQMDDSARFIFNVIGTSIQNAGYPALVPTAPDPSGEIKTVPIVFQQCKENAANTPCPVLGRDNSRIATSNVEDYGAAASSVSQNSDLLAIRFQGSSKSDGTADGNVVTCLGNAVPYTKTEANLGLSIFGVITENNEPSLACIDRFGGSARGDQGTIARGVESFQVMYGIDACKNLTNQNDPIPDGEYPCKNGPNKGSRKGAPVRWVNASNLGTNALWPYVAAIRVGLVLRGAPGSAQTSDSQTMYPLGKDFDNTNTYTVTDSRMRRAYVATFKLRNSEF